MDGDFLSEDFCVLQGKHFMVRAILPIPVAGLDEGFAFGCWATLSRANFERYVDTFDSGHQDQDLWFGWLANQLDVFVDDQNPIALDVQPRPGRQRPMLWVKGDDHPLAKAQAQGISAERMMEILAYYGHAPI